MAEVSSWTKAGIEDDLGFADERALKIGLKREARRNDANI
jgi:hypothetical protein